MLLQTLSPHGSISATSSDLSCASVTTVISSVHSDDYFSQKLAAKGLNYKLMLGRNSDCHQEKKGRRTKELLKVHS